ncbi:MAG: prolipoprotein diacylglyceryl transferase [Oscillospiraceae bacterium]|nr:prolipoprotein diacylglyceryl transferase [Oscillospiraceae bacterium]
MHVLPGWFRYIFDINDFLSLPAMLFFILLLVLPLLYSRRMNARLLPPSMKLRFLQQLAQGIAPPKLSGKRRQISGQNFARNEHIVSPRKRIRREKFSRAVLWLDWLLCDKLRLLPNAETGRTINVFVVLYFAWASSILMQIALRNQNVLVFMRTPLQLMLIYIAWLLLPLALIIPLVLLKRNRDIYMDFFALFFLWLVSYQKLRCSYWNCCLGVPWTEIGINRVGAFPIQPLEFAVGALLTIFCLLFMARSRWYKPGRGISLALISYALPRFFWEFLRHRYDIGWVFGLTVVQVVCIIAILLAIIWWFAVPLAKKVMDWINNLLHRALAWVYLRPRVHAKLSKYFNWHSSVAKLEEEQTT